MEANPFNMSVIEALGIGAIAMFTFGVILIVRWVIVDLNKTLGNTPCKHFWWFRYNVRPPFGIKSPTSHSVWQCGKCKRYETRPYPWDADFNPHGNGVF